jgi:hypothetical protein
LEYVDGGTELAPDGWLGPPPVMTLLAAHVPLQLLIDLASAVELPLPAAAYEWGPGRGRLWVSPWALDPVP